MNIIIVGCGKVGYKLTEQLAHEEEHNITVIDTNAEVVGETVADFDVLGVVGSGTDMDTLMEASVDNADVLIAV